MSPVHGNPVVVHPTNPDIWGDVAWTVRFPGGRAP